MSKDRLALKRFLIKGDLLTDSDIPIEDEIELSWPIGQCNLCNYEFIEGIHRVIRKGGVFFTHIANGRILGGDVPAYTHKQVYAKENSFEYLKENSIPSIKVGRDWLFNTIDECGFDPCALDILDSATDEYYTWFIGRRR